MGTLCAFKLFSLGYFIYLLLGLGISFLLVFLLRKVSEKFRDIINIAMFVSLFVFIVLEYIGRIILIEDFDFFDNLPFNFYQVFAVYMLITYIRRNIKWLKFAYLIVLPISIFSLIFMPKFYVDYSAFSVSLIAYVFIHVVLISMSALNILWEECELNKRDVIETNMIFVIMAGSIHIVNIFLRFTFIGVHSNLAGTMGEKYDLVIELLSTLIPVPFVFMLPIFVIVIGISFLLVIPFDLIQHKKQKQSEIEELIALGNLKKQQEYRKKNSKSSSQIYLNSATKAKPSGDKGVTNKTKTGFVAQNKEIQVNKDVNKN